MTDFSGTALLRPLLFLMDPSSKPSGLRQYIHMQTVERVVQYYQKVCRWEKLLEDGLNPFDDATVAMAFEDLPYHACEGKNILRRALCCWKLTAEADIIYIQVPTPQALMAEETELPKTAVNGKAETSRSETPTDSSHYDTAFDGSHYETAFDGSDDETGIDRSEDKTGMDSSDYEWDCNEEQSLAV